MAVEDSNVIDFVAHDPGGGVLLVMVEGRDWDGSKERLFQLQEKINSYASFALEGQLAEKYPELAGQKIRIELRYTSPPDPATITFLDAVRESLNKEGLTFATKQIGSHPTG